jgi:uncharacterized metal-binding protein/predicted Fe-Mo cluster-binding NifX family protein
VRVAVPVFGSRIAPNFTHCDQLLLGSVDGGRVLDVGTLDTLSLTEGERISLLEANEVAVLACGGIGHDLMVELRRRGIEVINNVAGETDQVLEHVARGDLRPGYGITYRPDSVITDRERGKPQGPLADGPVLTRDGTTETASEELPHLDCIACSDRVCLKGATCRGYPEGSDYEQIAAQLRQMMDVAMDIAAEPERILCRIAELVYFCVEMQYQHVGLAFCTDLLSESETVTRLLRRFVRVTPVCCRAGGGAQDQYGTASAICNPFGLARILNEAKTDLNVVVGLSMGCDVVFTRLSQAPVTTLFVKDKLLANNPVSAVHSRHVLERILERP